jgi:signal transduction histidine kinase
MDPSTGQAKAMIELALNNTDRLSRLVNDILDLQRIEAGQLIVNMQPVNASDLMRHSVEATRGLAAQSEVTINLHTVDETLDGDADRLVQALVNLLGNAIKFSPRGASVEFTAEKSGRNVIFRVRDHGRGIPPEQLEVIFERFAQVDASDSREKGGSGLGLAICRSIVQQHGGRVWAESQPGQGSTFSLQIPLGARPGSGEPHRRKSA